MNKKKILIIEDDQETFSMYSVVLEKEGFEVIPALNGKEGLIKAKSDTPDLILLDIILPGPSGFEVLEELKRDPNLKAVPVFMLTNLGHEDDLRKAHGLGADKYLVKADYVPSRVLEEVKAVLG